MLCWPRGGRAVLLCDKLSLPVWGEGGIYSSAG